MNTHTDTRLPRGAKRRLGGQNAKIMARLRKGGATNIQLEDASGSRRINSRVADVRRWLEESEDLTVACYPIDVTHGLYYYHITPKK